MADVTVVTKADGAGTALVAADIATGTPTVGYAPISTGSGSPAWGPAGGVATVTGTTVETNIGSTLKFAGKFTITDAAITAAKKVLCWQAPGPYTGKGTRADEAELQPVQVIAVFPAEGSATVYWQTPPYLVTVGMPTTGTPSTVANSGTNRDVQERATRIGKVRGNVKFTYTILT